MKKIYFKDVEVGIAPINWSNDDLPELGATNTFEQILSEAKLAGFSGVELGSKFPKDSETLKKHLALRELQLISGWFSSYILSNFSKTLEDFSKHVELLKKQNCKVVVVSEQTDSIQQLNLPLFDFQSGLKNEQWLLLGQGLNQMGEYALNHGLKLVYHHHMGTVVQSADDVRQLLKHTDSDKVYLLFDTGHFTMANENPLLLANEFSSRICHVHLKDVRKEIVTEMHNKKLSFLQGVILGMFTIPGDGVIDFEAVINQLAINAYKGWMVVEAEQDPAIAHPLTFAKKSMSYLKKIMEW